MDGKYLAANFPDIGSTPLHDMRGMRQRLAKAVELDWRHKKVLALEKGKRNGKIGIDRLGRLGRAYAVAFRHDDQGPAGGS